MQRISEKEAGRLVSRLSWMPGFPQSKEGVHAMASALMQVSRNSGHAQEIVDRMADDCERCPMPKNIIEAGNSTATVGAPVSHCGECHGDGFVLVAGDYGQVGTVKKCGCRA